MRKGVFITGTDTGIGKTTIAGAIVVKMREKGVTCGVMKPVESGGFDALFLKKVSGVDDPYDVICPYHFKKPFSPHLAAKEEKRKISVEKIVRSFNKLCKKYQFVVVEGAGGFLSPLDEKFLVADLIKVLNLPVIIVARTSLGTINHSLLVLEEAKRRGIEVVGIILNQCKKTPWTKVEKDNPYIISKLGNVKILGVVRFVTSPEKNLEKIAEKIKIDNMLEDKKKTDTEYLKKLDTSLIWHPYTQMQEYKDPIIVEEGKGCYLKDIDGNWYLDGVASIWTNVHGHRKKEIDDAIKRQIDKISHSTLLGAGNIPSILLAKKLIEIAPNGLCHVFYSDNGSTAVEVALKIAFQYFQHKKYKKKTKFISFTGAYHGDTIGAMSVGGIELFAGIFSPLLFKTFKVPAPYCYRCSFNLTYPLCKMKCADELKKIASKYKHEICAVIIEPSVHAAGGMIVQPYGFLKRVREICTNYNILMIADEIATGFGRTGYMFACDEEGISPDILCVAKSITGGYLPLAATLTTDEIYSAFLGKYSEKKTFFHGHTYTGCQLSCVAAIANLEIFEKEKILEKLKYKISYIRNELEKFKELKIVGDIRQKGMIVGIELVKDKDTKEPYLFEEKVGWKVAENAKKYGVLIRPLGNVVVIFPPLSISKKDLKKLLNAVYFSIKEAVH